jgi:exopolysaccharide biosynthesis polyprenyl glycosylphosphotransferase
VKTRTSILPFVLVESLALFAIVVPITHARSFGEQLLLSSQGDILPGIAPDEGRYILMRSALMVLALQVSFAFRDLYQWSVITRPQLTVVRLVEGIATVLVVLPLLHYVLGALDRNFDMNGALQRLEIHPMLVLAAAGASFLAAYGLRAHWPRWMQRARLGERVAIAGNGPATDVIEEEIRRRHDPGIDLVGFLGEPGEGPAGRTLLGPLGDAAGIVREHGVQRLVIDTTASLPSETLLTVRLENVRITDIASFHEQLTGRISVESLAGPDLFLTSSATGLFYKSTRRMLDIGAASVGLLLAAPLCAAVALLVRLESPGPVLYSQERVGRNGRPFTIYKFRSMRADAEAASGPVWASGEDPRITRVGRWLRRMRIDEIPQLWSVIRNDMSLVGPRPERPFFVGELARQIPHYGQRHIVKPGVTGWAQINYSYGNTLDDAFIKLQYDLYYIKNRSLALDVAIMLRTVKVVALQQGAV